MILQVSMLDSFSEKFSKTTNIILPNSLVVNTNYKPSNYEIVNSFKEELNVKHKKIFDLIAYFKQQDAKLTYEVLKSESSTILKGFGNQISTDQNIEMYRQVFNEVIDFLIIWNDEISNLTVENVKFLQAEELLQISPNQKSYNELYMKYIEFLQSKIDKWEIAKDSFVSYNAYSEFLLCDKLKIKS
jgi:hypothetical protein